MEKTPELHTPADIRAYIERETTRQVAEMHQKTDRIFRAKNSVWLLLLVVVYLEYYLIITMIQASSTSTLTLKIPVGLQQRCAPASIEQQYKSTPVRKSKASASGNDIHSDQDWGKTV